VNKEQAAKVKAKKPKKRGSRTRDGVSKRQKFLREITDKELLSGPTPVQVMLHNMRFFHMQAEGLLEELLGTLKENKQKLGPHHLEMLHKVYAYRNEAGKAACDAAPYLHPRLSAVAVTTTQVRRDEIPKDASEQDIQRIFEENAKRFPSIAEDRSGLLIEHQQDEAA